VVQSWIRQALRASGVAILVPVAVAVAIALSVIGGGGDVGSLGQVLAGPAVPPAETGAPAPAQPRRDERHPTRGTAVAALAGGTRPSPASATAPHQRRPVTTLPLGPRPHPIRPPAAAPAPTSATPPPGQQPQQPPPSQPRPIHDTGSQVADTVRPLPVAGPVAADAVQAVVDLVDPPL
jgi:hypothetical protein